MPIPLVCDACHVKLNAPDAAAGKRVKCPKCGKLLEIPNPQADFEVIEESPTMMLPTPSLPAMKSSLPTTKPKPKPVTTEASPTTPAASSESQRAH